MGRVKKSPQSKPKATKIEVKHTGIKIYEGLAVIYKSKKLDELVIVLKQKGSIEDAEIG